MRSTLRQKLSWLLPGRIDGMLLLTVFVTACLCLVPWIFVFQREYVSIDRSTVLNFSILFGAAVGVVTAMDFYFVFGRGSLTRRFVVAMLMTAIPSLAVSISFCLAAQRKAWGINLEVFRVDRIIYAVICQRWVVLSALALLSVFLRAMTRGRAGTLTQAERSDSQGNTTIGQMLLLTGFVAVALVSARFALMLQY